MATRVQPDSGVMKFVDSLKRLADWLWGCGHNKTTLPMTHNARTYVVCLGCGRQLPYDWGTMHKTSRWSAGRAATDQPDSSQVEKDTRQ